MIIRCPAMFSRIFREYRKIHLKSFCSIDWLLKIAIGKSSGWNDSVVRYSEPKIPRSTFFFQFYQFIQKHGIFSLLLIPLSSYTFQDIVFKIIVQSWFRVKLKNLTRILFLASPSIHFTFCSSSCSFLSKGKCYRFVYFHWAKCSIETNMELVLRILRDFCDV